MAQGHTLTPFSRSAPVRAVVGLEGVTPEKLRETFGEVQADIMRKLSGGTDYGIEQAHAEAFLAGVLLAEVELAAQFGEHGVNVILQPHDFGADDLGSAV